MSLAVNRSMYFPGTGSASSPGFDAAWGSTGGAVTLPGIWDNRSNTADTQYSISTSITSSGSVVFKKCLAAQFIFPAFTGMTFDGPVTGAHWLVLGSPGLVAMTKRVHVSGPTIGSGVGGGLIGLVVICRVMKADNTFRYYLSSSNVGSPLLKVSTVLTGNGAGNGISMANSAPLATDYLVVEVGFLIQSSTTAGTSINTLTLQVGDGHPAYQVDGSVAAGNSGSGMTYLTTPSATASGGGWTYTGPLAPTILPKVVSLVTSQQPSDSSQLNDILGNSRGFNG